MTDEERKERRQEQVRRSREKNKHKYAEDARTRATKWYHANKHRPEVVEKYRAASRERSLEATMFYSARVRADKTELPFDITREDITIPAVCPIFKKPFEKGTEYAPSLDRIKPELGYVKGNIAVISRLANAIKNCGTADDHRRIADWMDAFENV